MKKNIFKILSVFLSVLMIVMSVPLTAFAADVTDNTSESVTLNTDIIELTDKRTATSKTFRLDDGSYYVAEYDTEIHYLDENGLWQDIDNTLAASGSEFSTSNAKIKFAKKITGNETIFTLHDGNRKLTLSLNGAFKKTDGVITNASADLGEDATKLQKMTTLEKISASILYADILPSTDLEYVVKGLTVKENIIVKEKADDYTYTFTMKLNNLTAIQTESGEIYIMDPSTGETVYYIPAPIMWDADYVTSNQVTMTLSGETGEYTLTITADAEWMNAPDRAYPVTIDPPIYAATGSNVTDLSIFSNSPTDTGASMTTLNVGATWRSYWKLNSLPALPASAYITDAQLSLQGSTDGTLSGYVSVYDVLTAWDSTLTWNKTVASSPQGKAASAYSDFQAVSSVSTPEGYVLNKNTYTWNVTPIVKGWYTEGNNGLMLAPASDTSFTGMISFYSNDYSVSASRPQLCIRFQDMKGIEDQWSFSSQSAGFAGTGSVNHATGNLVFSISTLTSTDALMPITPALVYNSALAGLDHIYPNAEVAVTTSYAPKGFKLNLSETLIMRGYDATNYYFVWSDSDGTEHYFLPVEYGTGEMIYEDEEGLHLTLVFNTSTATATITDDNDTVRSFAITSYPSAADVGFALSSITDKNGNKVSFSLDSNGRPTTVTLTPVGGSAIEQLKIAYNSTGNPYAIWNPTSKEGVVFRYSSSATATGTSLTGDYLTQVVRAHGGSTAAQWLSFYNTNANTNTSTITVDGVAKYTYDNAGRLLTAENTLAQYKLEYAYDAGRVVSVKEYATNTSAVGQQFSIEYGTSSAVIRTSGTDDVFNTSDDLLTTYGFDPEGRTVSIYTTDLNKTQVYGASNGQYVDDNEKAKNNLKSSVVTTQHSSNYLLNGGFEATLPYWGTTGGASLSGSTPYTGEKSADLLVHPGMTSASIYQYVTLEKGDYSLSLRIHTQEAADLTVYLKAESTTNASHVFTERISVNENYATGTYSFANLNFTSTPSTTGGTEQFKISILVTGAPENGSMVSIDDVMLAKALGTTEFGMVEMGHFESSNGTHTPDDFWFVLDNLQPSITIVDSGLVAFGDVLKIDAGLDEYEFIYQSVYQATTTAKNAYVPGQHKDEKAPILFTVSGWGKGTGQTYTDTSHFKIRVKITYYNGSSYPSEYYDFAFDKGITDWQFISGGFATNPNLGMIDNITVTIMYNDHVGEGYFDNISLVRDSSTTEVYNYNTNGYMSGVKSGRVQTSYQYDSNDNVIAAISSDFTLVEYKYDAKDRLIGEYHCRYTGKFTSSDTVLASSRTGKTKGVISGYVYDLSYSEYGYNAYGQPTTVTVYDKPTNWTAKTSTSTTYNTDSTDTHIFGTVESTTDALGKVTEYFYDTANGRQLAVIYPNDTGVTYTYDAMGNLTQVLPAVSSSSEGYSPISGSASVAYDYNRATKRLEKITTATGTVYTFAYDGFGNTTSIDAGDYTLVNYTYNTNNGKLNTLTYSNGLAVKYLYDALDRVSEIQYNVNGTGFDTVYSYTYDAMGNVFSVTDYVSNEVTLYRYDSENKLVSSYVYDRDTYLNLYGTYITYDEESRVSIITQSYDYEASTGVATGNTVYTYTYRDGKDGAADSNGTIKELLVQAGSLTAHISPTYNNLGQVTARLTGVIANGDDYVFINNTTYSYATSTGGSRSSLVSQLISSVRPNNSADPISVTTYNFTYNDNGNITKITDASGTIQYQYAYDDLGQLVREDNRALGKSYTFAYDNAGNIKEKKTYAFTTGTLGAVTATVSYTYGDSTWKDLLTKYGNTNITYDEIGNPITIGTATLTWQGRQLTSYTDNGTTVSYTYNADGIRTSKTIVSGGTTTKHEYILSGSQIVRETVYNGSTEAYTVLYIYDEARSPIAFRYRTPSYAAGVYDNYFLEKNLQGDIVAIYNTSGSKIVTYTYDAWGNFTIEGTQATTIGALNPFRYRGYYFDTEINLYYLQSRYYNSVWARFINPDHAEVITATPAGLTDKNLFAYCDNNPITRVDGDGEFWNTLIGTVVGAVVGGVTAAVMGTDIKAGIVSGAISGAISGAALDIAIATGGAGLVVLGAVTIASGAGGGVSSYVNQRMNGTPREEVDWLTVGIDSLFGAVGGAFSFGLADVGGAASKTLKQILSQPLRKIGQQAVEDFVATTIVTAGMWLNGTKLNTIKNAKSVPLAAK